VPITCRQRQQDDHGLLCNLKFMIAQPVQAPRGTAQGISRRFYRPELDALRFFALLGVLIHHGPKPHGFANLVRSTGGFGLSMFFVLSAYLITELLLREREQSGTVAWGLFFTRRALRIWPLYYAALAANVVIVLAGLPPHRFPITGSGVAAMSLFVANWIPIERLGSLFATLWSISVEEQFYLIWPPIIKLGGKTLVFTASLIFAISAVVWLWIFSGRGWRLWFDTPVEFLFFAAGAMIALATRGNREPAMGGLIRGSLLIAGLFSLAIGARVGGVTDGPEGLTIARLYIGYGSGLIGCAVIFVATLGMPRVPRWLTYLGKISYGLYVFHVPMLILAQWLTISFDPTRSSVLYMVITDSFTLLLCVLAAHLSYQYFEAPFLRLKERFAVIKSRPA
jgi:peptidoglycan/LPS O-acetylase OafA/YrhL